MMAVARRLVTAKRSGINQLLITLAFLLFGSGFAICQPTFSILDSAIKARTSQDYETALTLYFKVEESSIEHGDNLGLARCYRELGTFYGQIADYPSSLKYLNKGLSILSTKLQDSSELSKIYNNLGIVYDLTGQFDEALKYHRKSASLKKSLADSSGLARTFDNMGECHRALLNRDSAIYYYHLSLSIHERLENHHGIASALNNLAALYKNEAQYDTSLFYYRKALIQAEFTQDLYLLRRIYLFSSKVYLQVDSPLVAYTFHENYASLNDSILQLESKDKLAKIEARHRVQQLEKENAHLEKESGTRIFIFTLSALLLLAMGFLAFLWQRKRTQKARMESELYERSQKIAVERAADIAAQLYHKINNNLGAARFYYFNNKTKEGNDVLKGTMKEIHDLAVDLGLEKMNQQVDENDSNNS